MCRGLRDFLQFICDIVQAIHLSGKRHYGDHVLRKIAYDCDSFFVIIFFRHRDLEIPFMSIVYLNTLGFSSDSAQAFLRAPKLCLIGFINEGSGNYAFIAGCHIFEEQASFVRGKIHDISCVIRTGGSVKQVRIVDVSTVTY